MNLFGRVTIGLLWMVGSMPIMANTIWTDGMFGNAGALPDTAQMIWGDNTPLDAIFGNLSDANGAAMFRILITDPFNFTATVMPDPFDPDTQVIPQIFLFDSGGLPLAGGYAAMAGEASLPPWFSPNVPGFYLLMVNSVGSDPIFTETLPDGTQTQQPLFCGDPYSPSWWACDSTATQPINSYQGQGFYAGSNDGPLVNGAYAILLTGATAPAPVPEPGSAFLLLGGAVLLLAGKKRHYRARR